MSDTVTTSCALRHGIGVMILKAAIPLFAVAGLACLVYAGTHATRDANPDADETAATEFVRNAGRGVVSDIVRVVSPAIERGRKLSESAEVRKALKANDTGRLTRLCNAAIQQSTEIDVIAVFDGAGRIQAINTVYSDGRPIDADRVDRVMNRDFSSRDIIMACVRNNARSDVLEFQTKCDITPAYFDSSGLSVAHSVPVLDESGLQIGLVSTRLRFERLTNLLEGYRIAGGAGAVEFVSDAGDYFDERVNSGDVAPTVTPDVLAAIVAPLTRGDVSHLTVKRGTTYFGLFRAEGLKTLDRGGIQVMVSVPEPWLVRESRMSQILSAGKPAAMGLLFLSLCGFSMALNRNMAHRRRLNQVVGELQGFLGTTPELLCMLDGNSRFLKLNSAWGQFLGRPVADLVGEPIVPYVHPDDLSGANSALGALADGGPVETFVIRCRNGAGEYRHLEWQSRKSEGIVYGAARDVTERLHKDRELGALEQNLRLFIEHSPAAVAMFDPELRYLHASQGWHQQYNIKNRRIEGVRHYDLFPSIPERWKEVHRRALAGETLSADRDFVEYEDGTRLWVRWQVRPWYTAEKKIGGIIIYSEVINDQIENEQRLEEARRQAESASSAKSEFLANMSHEIRTPMTAILGFAETLLEPDRTDEERESTVLTIRRNGEHLLQVINDILDISKIESGKLQVECIACSPIELVREVHSMMSDRAESKGLKFQCRFEGSIPRTIQCDPTRLRQILVNLVGNAIKFTSRGAVRLTARLVHPNPDTNPTPIGTMMEFAVLDTGIGVSSDQLSELFRPFSQADGSTTRIYGGTGLGLMISRRLAKLLGGDVQVDSIVGMGSCFRVQVASGPIVESELVVSPGEPAAPSNPLSSQGAETGQLKDLKILLAEDSIDSQRLISHFLRRAKADVHAVANGQMAVDACLSAVASGRPFDVILMDMQMPVMDGYQATRVLRNAGYEGRIIALTAHAMQGDMDKCIDAGCDAYETKPIDRKRLIDRVRSSLPDQWAH